MLLLYDTIRANCGMEKVGGGIWEFGDWGRVSRYELDLA